MTQNEIDRAEWQWALIASILLLFALSFPFMLVYMVTGPEAQFTGYLVDPVDGVFYQATMHQGELGDWVFHLPYTPEAHDGVLLFAFYIALGHLARFLNLPLVLVFHAARLVGGVFMLLMIYLFMADWTDDVRQRRIGWVLAVVGSGFGWVSLLFDYLPPDIFTLHEAFPLQAAYANAHFPWAIAVGVWMAHTLLAVSLVESDSLPLLDVRTVALVGGTMLLVWTAPTLLVSLIAGYLALLVRLWYRRKHFPHREFSWLTVILIFAIPLIAYQAWVFSPENPVFEQWWLQVQSFSLRFWEYLIAFGPLLILAAVGIWRSWPRLHTEDYFLLGGIAIYLPMLFLPINRGAHASIGLIIPLSVYGSRALWRVIAPLFSDNLRWQQFVSAAILALVIPTTILAILVPFFGAVEAQGGYPYFITAGEAETLRWIDAHTPPDALILAPPETSLYIPTVGRRVVYGHPTGTLKAEERFQAVQDFYDGTDCSVVEREQVDFIIFDPAVPASPDESRCSFDGDLVFRSAGSELLIYDVRTP